MMKRVVIALLALCTLGVEGRVIKGKTIKTSFTYDAANDRFDRAYDKSSVVEDFADSWNEFIRAAKSELGSIIGQQMIDEKIKKIKADYPDFDPAKITKKTEKKIEPKPNGDQPVGFDVSKLTDEAKVVAAGKDIMDAKKYSDLMNTEAILDKTQALTEDQKKFLGEQKANLQAIVTKAEGIKGLDVGKLSAMKLDIESLTDLGV